MILFQFSTFKNQFIQIMQTVQETCFITACLIYSNTGYSLETFDNSLHLYYVIESIIFVIVVSILCVIMCKLGT